jgi:hypothetical protein
MAKKPVHNKSVPKKEPTKPKVFICTPMYGGMCTGTYTLSLLQMQAAFAQLGLEAQVSAMMNESLITRARNALVHQFLKTDCTHLLFIDADISWTPADVLHMFKVNVDVICGVYPKKEINWHTVKAAVEAGVPVEQLKHHTGAWVINLVNYEGQVTVRADQPLEVFAGGTGMMLIKRKVFDKLGKTVPTYKNDVGDTSGNMKDAEVIKEFFATSIEPETQRLLSEDYHFCRIWREAGGKVHAAPWMGLGHTGTYCFEGRFPQSD